MPHISSFCRRVLLALAIGLGLVVLLPAQNVLRIEHEGKFKVVRKVIGMQAYVMINDKLVAVPDSRCALQPVEEFVPTLVSVRDMNTRTEKVRILGGAAELAVNHKFHFWATFESPVQLDDVFLVLDLDTAYKGRTLFYYEVGRLEPYKPTMTSVDFMMLDEIGSAHYQLHLFTAGGEVFNSEQPLKYREGKLDQMVAKRITGVLDAGPKPFMCPAPNYPARLRDKNLKGEAVVAFQLTARGSVINPVVSRATDSAFGEAALAAVRQWRFLPAVAQGHAVATKANMPFKFEP